MARAWVDGRSGVDCAGNLKLDDENCRLEREIEDECESSSPFVLSCRSTLLLVATGDIVDD
jgi:hypothetical protein